MEEYKKAGFACGMVLNALSAMKKGSRLTAGVDRLFHEDIIL
jgi:hypothetical protein